MSNPISFNLIKRNSEARKAAPLNERIKELRKDTLSSLVNYPGLMSEVEDWLRVIQMAEGGTVEMFFNSNPLSFFESAKNKNAEIAQWAENIFFDSIEEKMPKSWPFATYLQQVGNHENGLPIMAVFKISQPNTAPNQPPFKELNSTPPEEKDLDLFTLVSMSIALTHDINHRIRSGLPRDLTIHILEQHIRELKALENIKD